MNPSVEVTGDSTVHVVWIDFRGGDYEVYHKKHDGTSWGPDIRVTSALGLSWNPAVYPDPGENLHLVWHDSRTGSPEIYYNKFNGTSWGSASRLTYDAAKSKDPAIAVDPAGDIHVIWHDERSGGVDVYWKWYIRDPVPGPAVTSIAPLGWPADEGVPVTNLAGAGFLPLAEVRLQRAGEPDLSATDVVVASPGRITCTIGLAGAAEGYWDVAVQNIDGQVHILESCFLVVSSLWTEDTRLTVDSCDSYTSKPNARCVAADPAGKIHVVWHDCRDGNNEICYKQHDGVAWGVDERLTNAAEESAYPSIAAGGDGSLHVVWHDFRDGNYEIYYKQYNGIAWGADERLTDEPSSSSHPSIAVDDTGNLYVVWQDERGTYTDIYFMMFDGQAWSAPEAVKAGENGESAPAIAVDGNNNVHVVWYEDVLGANNSLGYRMYDGIGWSADTLLATERDLGVPSIAADEDGKVHITWHDYRYETDGQYEVMYKLYDGSAWGPDERLTHADGFSYNTPPSRSATAVLSSWCGPTRETAPARSTSGASTGSRGKPTSA